NKDPDNRKHHPGLVRLALGRVWNDQNVAWDRIDDLARRASDQGLVHYAAAMGSHHGEMSPRIFGIVPQEYLWHPMFDHAADPSGRFRRHTRFCQEFIGSILSI